MLNSLKLYFNSMHHTVEKEQVLKSLEFIMKGINEDVIPSFDLFISSSDLSKLKDNAILDSIGYSTGMPYKDNRDILVKLKGGFVNISKAESALTKLIKNELPDMVTDKTATPKDLAILKIVSDLGSMCMFILDLLYLFILDPSQTNLPKKKLEGIKANIPSFTEAFKAYGSDFSKLLKETSKVTSNKLDINDGNISILNKILAKTGKLINLPIARGFINNPIYHIRLWLVDREVTKYESLKEKKRLIELKLMELKLDGQSDPSITKQIEYYEDKLAKIDHQIEKIEAD